MGRFVYSLVPQVSHFVRALGDNPALVVIALAVSAGVIYSACMSRSNLKKGGV